MKRYCSLEEISDGRLYDINDLVEAGCNSCKGSASCCHGTGNTVILDPFDLYCLTTNLNKKFDELLTDKIELNFVDGVILPNLKMTGASEGCTFLNGDGRCSIHAFRPGICRIFPLGRYYENHDFRYFLQVNECKSSCSNNSVEVGKWIDTPDLKKNKKFLIDWHYFLNDVENEIKSTKDQAQVKKINMFLINCFYLIKYDTGTDFYLQFHKRLNEAKRVLTEL